MISSCLADRLIQHIFLAGLSGLHPLRGPNVDEFGVRFPPLSDAYDLSLRRCVHNAWRSIDKSEKRRLHEGVYAFVSGPRYEHLLCGMNVIQCAELM